jgi:hypothetical protein
LSKSAPLSHPVIVSTITADQNLKWQSQPFLSMSDLGKVVQTIDQPEVRRVRVSVVSFQLPESGSLKDCIRIMDKKTGKVSQVTAKT